MHGPLNVKWRRACHINYCKEHAVSNVAKKIKFQMQKKKKAPCVSQNMVK